MNQIAKRRSKKQQLSQQQVVALVAIAILVAGFVVYGDTLTGLATGTITFTVTGSASVSLDDAAATITSGTAGQTKNTSTGANEMHLENNGNTDLTCTIYSDEAGYTTIFGGSGAGSPTFKYYSYNDEASSATHVGTVSSKATLGYGSGAATNIVTGFQFEDTTDEIYLGFETLISSDAAVAAADTTTVTITCS